MAKGYYSEFHELDVTPTVPVPLDLSGALSAAITVVADTVYVANERSMPNGQRFAILNMAGDGASFGNVTPFVIKSCDARLWLQSDSGPAKVYVWVTKETGE